MHLLIKNRKIKILFIISVILLLAYTVLFFVLPEQLTLFEGEDYINILNNPFIVSIKSNKEDVIKLTDTISKGDKSFVKLTNPLTLRTKKNGRADLDFKLFGIIPLKTMHVDVMPTKKIIPCGNTIGVKLCMSGVMVIGLSDVQINDGKKVFPSRDCGIKAGDIITEANKNKITNIADLEHQVELSSGNKLNIKYKRGNRYINSEVKPVKAFDDKKYHIGLWVRDSAAGIGTLTFYDADTKCFGALGHGITDIDAGAMIPVACGDILESNILSVKKGKRGNPGELKGVFVENDNKFGEIKNNCDFGIFGILLDSAMTLLPSKVYPIALQNEVVEGPATILANINGKSVEEYQIEIQKVSKQNITGLKGMILKITDERLLNTTGGIVQGMSGSPILQNNKIIGAVTHVLVNDPTRGYGIFIECMVKCATQNESKIS